MLNLVVNSLKVDTYSRMACWSSGKILALGARLPQVGLPGRPMFFFLLVSPLNILAIIV